MPPSIALRQIGAEDGPKIAALGEQTPDTGAVGFHNIYYYDPYATTLALHQDAIGVVAEALDHDGIVGVGMMCMGECQHNGELRPYAYLFGLSVHPDYRRRGIASQLAAWRIDKARALMGDDVVIFAGVQQGNEGSLAAAAKWSSQRIDGRVMTGVVKMRSSPPAAMVGLTVRPAEKNEYEEIAEKQNRFYGEFNLYPPRSAEELYQWHQVAPFGARVRDYFVAVDQTGNLIAGLSATAEGRLTVGQVVRMPWSLRLANFLLRVLPVDSITKRIHVKDLWYAPQQMEASQYLWESVRWLQREAGTMMVAFYDAQGRFGQIIQPPSYMPPQGGALVMTAPSRMGEERLIYLQI